MLLFDRYVGGCFVSAAKFCIGRFRAVTLLLLLFPVLVRAQALASDPLPATEAPAERAAYCLYVLARHLKGPTRPSDISQVLSLATQLKSWKQAYRERYAEESRGAGLAAALKHYDERVAAYAEGNQTDISRAQTLLVQQALEPCKQELAALEANASPAGKAPDLPSVPPESSVAGQQVAGPWEQMLFSGAWETPQLGLKHYNRIRFMLWDDGKGLPEGVAQFFKGRASCVGTLELDAHQQLGFSLFEGKDCDDIDRGRFKLVDGTKKDRMRLSFSPGDAREDPRSQVANLFYMRRMRAIPEALQAYQDRLKGRKAPLRQVLERQADEHRQILDQIYADLKQGYSARFDASKLLGVWQGRFIDRRRSYKAEIALWSSTPHRLRQAVGLVRFDNRLCHIGVLTSRFDSYTEWNMGPLLATQPIKECVPVEGAGRVQLDSSGGQMALFLNTRLGVVDEIGADKCIDKLSRPGLDGQCYTVGLFKRAKASPAMREAMQQVQWQTVQAPTPDDWRVIRDNGDGMRQLQRDHEQGVADNVRVLAQIEEEKVMIQRKQEEERRQMQEEAARERQIEEQRRQRIDAAWAAEAEAEASGNLARPALVPPPEVSGPFDGLKGASFFNAMYKGDFDTVRQYTTYYQERKIRQRQEAMGGQPHIMDGILDSAFRSVSLASNMMAVYLFNYDSQYQSCLGDDAATFTVVRVYPEVVTTNLIGVEIARSYGFTTRKTYRVKKVFENAFRRVGRMQPSGVMGKLSDWLLNAGGTDLRNEVVAGTRMLMARFTCDSPEIQRLEQNLLRFRDW